LFRSIKGEGQEAQQFILRLFEKVSFRPYLGIIQAINIWNLDNYGTKIRAELEKNHGLIEQQW
jgi:hypothetical protein